jgi:flagellar assembly factor FliW
MRIKTAHFGEIAIQPEDVLELQGGLIPFVNLVRYVLLAHQDEYPFQWLQSVEVPQLAVVTVPLSLSFPDFRPRLDEVSRQWLQLPGGQEPLWLVTVVLADRLEKMTANLLAPIAFHLPARRGKQVVQELGVEWARKSLAESKLLAMA